jgi:YidC/Oxa1 family membrane protein insertase
LHLLLATSWLDPIVNVLWQLVVLIDKPLNNFGWTLIILAALIRLVFWPLNAAQFRAFMNMQKIAPQIKRLQAKYKDDQQKLQQETMALYRANKVNPLAGCWPMLVQYPVIISVYYVVTNHRSAFEQQSWMWIGSSLSNLNLKIFGVSIFAQSLAHPDLVLILLYALSMYLSVRYGSMPATDPQQAQTQRMMAIISPLMLGFLGWKYQWPSAMVLYWFSYNVFTMGQQFYMLRRFHQPLSMLDSEHVITDDTPANQKQLKPADASDKSVASTNGAAARSASPRTPRSKRKNRKGS